MIRDGDSNATLPSIKTYNDVLDNHYATFECEVSTLLAARGHYINRGTPSKTVGAGRNGPPSRSTDKELRQELPEHPRHSGICGKQDFEGHERALADGASSDIKLCMLLSLSARSLQQQQRAYQAERVTALPTLKRTYYEWLNYRVDWEGVVMHQLPDEKACEKVIPKLTTTTKQCQRKIFPSVAKLSRVWFGRTISTAFQERVFATGSFVMSPLRTRTDNERAQRHLILRHNRMELQRMDESKYRIWYQSTIFREKNMAKVKLCCGVYGEGAVFSVDLERNADVEALQKVIVNEKKNVNYRFNVDPSSLTLYLARKECEETKWRHHYVFLLRRLKDDSTRTSDPLVMKTFVQIEDPAIFCKCMEWKHKKVEQLRRDYFAMTSAVM
ncbi:hypothetical protein PI126_g7196 [Phytophthora idaei]|nr:hypothetical protein PI126_g7196 [Phytophthora idaei]